MAHIVTESNPDFVRMSFSSQQQSCWVFQDAFINVVRIEVLAISRHTREDGYPGPKEQFEKTVFPLPRE